MKPGWILLLVAALVAAVSVLSWRLGYHAAVAEAIETPKADTLIIRDTVTVEIPAPQSLKDRMYDIWTAAPGRNK